MTISTDVAIVGAGPYGLSIAAHLRAHGIEHRIFGSPMLSWRAQMPKGMFLKSEGFASNLHDPSGYSLQRFCAENNLPYADTHQPVALDTFIDYGLAFQRHSAPNVEEKSVVALEPAASGLALRLDTGESLTAQRVVLAVGLNYFRYIPDYLAHLPGELLTHSADHHDVSGFKDQDVSVIGGGASALDLVAALKQAGARPRLVARRRAIKWNLPLGSTPKLRLSPLGGLGGGWRNYAIEHAPMLYRKLPPSTRLHIASNWLGPAGGWPSKPWVERGTLFLGQTLRSATPRASGVELRLVGPYGEETALKTDHVIAATGYKVDVGKLAFVHQRTRAQLRTIEQTPVLSADFQSSVPGLYFVGLAAVNSFGPVMRFLLGGRYTARRLVKHFAGKRTR
jgi:FAD-dependent urate hydroxylase